MSLLRWDVLGIAALLAVPLVLMAAHGEMTADQLTSRLPWCLVAAWLLIGQLGSVDLLSTLRSADWGWAPAYDIDRAFSGPALQPAEPQALARMDQIIGIVDAYAYWPLVRQVFSHAVFRPPDGLCLGADDGWAL